ncbi:hypothetical protein O1611_g3274 [Lasiodiplodia mahajangana]|uniref:Uncharacterized protein n=1 Tax=Lasiodiplodia mahajangana TaxID=1108764 RepID=A0ACC2JSN8_9PEZI|nr:hypothetical protein O1611_g3274 [Lasiodiplodia mahajangana]
MPTPEQEFLKYAVSAADLTRPDPLQHKNKEELLSLRTSLLEHEERLKAKSLLESQLRAWQEEDLYDARDRESGNGNMDIDGNDFNPLVSRSSSQSSEERQPDPPAPARLPLRPPVPARLPLDPPAPRQHRSIEPSDSELDFGSSPWEGSLGQTHKDNNNNNNVTHICENLVDLDKIPLYDEEKKTKINKFLDDGASVKPWGTESRVQSISLPETAFSITQDMAIKTTNLKVNAAGLLLRFGCIVRKMEDKSI